MSDSNKDGLLDFLDPNQPQRKPVPVINEWGMIIMAGLLALFGLFAIRRRLRV
ncbi:MAG: IPTL-CTERM sorting domain-containing protein [Deltaproteobacteria bacterium]|nr:IPTL-CTERM sorting domain-containing protein [Deltaproteobacteria bacterium]